MSYMSARFVDLLRESTSCSASIESVVVYCTAYQKHANMKIAIIMAAEMPYCSSATLPGKAYCISCTCGIESFTCALARKYYEKMEAFIQSASWEFH